jgi:Flp pilus assembly protein TadD
MPRFRDIPEGVKRWIPPLAAAAAAVAVFLPVLQFEFLEYDDLIYVFESPLSAALSLASIANAFLEPYFRSYAPLTLLTHAIDLRVWGQDGGMHHLLNLLLHSLNAALVYHVARGIFSSGSLRIAPESAVFAAFSAALLFAVHPLQSEPVAWISGRKDVLMAFFLLVSFLAYLRWRSGEEDARWLVVSSIVFMFALLSKSTAAAYPLVLLACDRLVLGRRESWSLLAREKSAMLVAAGVAVLVAVLAGRGHDTSDLLAGFPPAIRVLLPIFTPAFYLGQLVWPMGLTPFTPPAPLPWVFVGAGATVIATALLVRRNAPGPLVAWLSFLLLLVPTIGGTFMETGMQPWADRFTYAPLIPVFIAVGAGVCRIPRPQLRFSLLIVLALGLAAVSRAQLEHWRSTESIWTRVVHSSPGLAKGYKNLGSIRYAQGRGEEAIQLFRKAVVLKPAYGEAYSDLGLALSAAGRFDDALEAYRTSIAVEPARVEGYNGYGIALLRTGDARGAYEAFQRGIAVDSAAVKLRYNAGMAALAAGDTTAAIARFQETAALDSSAARAAENAAVLLDARGDAAARLWYERAAAAGSAGAKAWLANRGFTGGRD